MQESKEVIYDSLKEEIQPLRLNEISEKTHYSVATVHRAIRELIHEDKIKIINGKNQKYYSVIQNSNTNSNPNNIRDIIDEETVNVKELYNELQSQFNDVNSKINNIYTNILTLMGIFVALFSLISINAGVVFDLTKHGIKDVIYSVIAVNAVTVVSILILLFGIYIITKNKKIK